MGSESVLSLPSNVEVCRDDFPNNFVFGCATSAYQVEGAYQKGGRTLSIWDVFSNGYPENIHDKTNGNVAVDMYNRYKEDIKMMRTLGFEAYRFSISWSRILPGGKLSLGINQEGIDYYNDLINTIIANGMKPFVTLFHWDLPYILEQEYGGFLGEQIVEDFRDFAELCFWEFGDRVQYWITINEALTYAALGYSMRTFPPGEGYFGPEGGHKNAPVERPKGHEKHAAILDMLEENADTLERIALNSDDLLNEGHNFVPYRGVRVAERKTFEHNGRTIILRKFVGPPKYDDPEKAKEAYTAGRNILLCHAAAAQSYRHKFQKLQKGQIGMTNNIHWFEPFNDTELDRKAARRALDFMLGWFLEPVLTGQYPKNMLDFAPRERLQPFTKEESALLKGSCDFVGINFYTAFYATHDDNPDVAAGYYNDQKLKFKFVRDGKPIGEPTGGPWLYVCPWAFHKLLKFLKDTFDNPKYKLPPIYITENGCDQMDDPKQTPYEACRDSLRVRYFREHLYYLQKAINEDKVNVRGHFAWSFCDNYEWADGYRSRFGVVYVDYKNDLKRYRKDSAMWINKFLLNKTCDSHEDEDEA